MNTIQGLTVTVGGSELATLCRAQAAHHCARRDFYQAKVNALSGIDERDGSQNLSRTSARDPAEEMAHKVREHENAANELQFIIDHLEPDSNYMLGRGDLARIGVIR